MNPREIAAEQAQELLAAAARDEVTFHILRKASEAPLETTLFHAQQAVEKGLKAVLVSAGVVFRRTHDLLELLDLAGAQKIAVPLERTLLARLAPYAVEFRYLGTAAPKVSLEEADAAVDALMAWARLQVEAGKGDSE
ncbi:HEPN domain-containing protein [Azospira restricta]|uniref:HEPN domain-containing protein n=1 Tax=Azospira restricta TaxID=404405 RepID=A0A974PX49_9RHOO|nr:HEPN domain-containing protein [Azospira restricta]QRJ62941.1 HEPN domain-containing protein [Azospira restricta]